jgi:hypothetical protein
MPIVLLQYMLHEDYFTHIHKKRKLYEPLPIPKSKPIKIPKTTSKVFTFSKHDIKLSEFNALEISQRQYDLI